MCDASVASSASSSTRLSAPRSEVPTVFILANKVARRPDGLATTRCARNQRPPSPPSVAPGELGEAAERVREPHLLDRPAARVEQARARDEVGQALRARDRHVQAVAGEEEV